MTRRKAPRRRQTDAGLSSILPCRKLGDVAVNAVRVFRPDGGPLIARPHTVGETIDLYLTHTRTEQAARTYDERRRILVGFAADCGHVRLEDAKPFHLRLWVDGQEQWASDWTKKRAIATVKRAMNWAAKLGITDNNPFWGVTQRDGENGRPMRPVEFATCLRLSSAPFRRVLFLMRLTGARPGEVASIEPENIDLERGLIILPGHKTRRTQRTPKPRVLVLEEVAARLVAYLLRTMMPDQQKLFVNSRGSTWNRYSISCRMKRLRKKAKLPRECKTYGLRHRFGTDAIRNGVNLKKLALLMGHTSTRCTERYVHCDEDFDMLKKAAKQALGRK
jgi:site-specific recombinase XerD